MLYCRPDVRNAADAHDIFHSALAAAQLVQNHLAGPNLEEAEALLYAFWEALAAPLLQPGPAGSHHIAWLDRLSSRGLLGTLLAAMAAAGSQRGLQYLDHTDADAAVHLLLFITVVPQALTPGEVVFPKASQACQQLALSLHACNCCCLPLLFARTRQIADPPPLRCCNRYYYLILTSPCACMHLLLLLTAMPQSQAPGMAAALHLNKV